VVLEGALNLVAGRQLAPREWIDKGTHERDRRWPGRATCRWARRWVLRACGGRAAPI
jgi:hypothetical protein